MFRNEFFNPSLLFINFVKFANEKYSRRTFFLFLYVSFNLNEPLYILRRVRLLSLSFMAFDEAFPRARMARYSHKCLELSGRFNFKVNFNFSNFPHFFSFFLYSFVSSLNVLRIARKMRNDIKKKKKYP